MFSCFNMSIALFILLTTHITSLCVTVYLHRYLTHRAFLMHPRLEQIMKTWLWLTTGIVKRQWVAVHRKHHIYADTDQDPYGPSIVKMPRFIWQGVFIYHKSAQDRKETLKFDGGMRQDFFDNPFGIFAFMVICVLFFGKLGLLIWATQMLWITIFLAGLVNGSVHTFGYRNFNTRDQSRNIFPIGIIACGEELHNNHHRYPTSHKFSEKWFEFDLGYFWIRLFVLTNLIQLPFSQKNVK